MLLPPLPPSLSIAESDAKPAAEDHTRACELQLWYMVVDAWLWSPNWYILYIHIRVSDNRISLNLLLEVKNRLQWFDLYVVWRKVSVFGRLT
jgi:hypothetical protein